LQLNEGALTWLQLRPEQYLVQSDRPQQLHYIQFFVVPLYAILEGLGFFKLRRVDLFPVPEKARATR